MSQIITLLVVTLVTQCWGSPQWKNWTPQAILYLKGAQGHRSVLERTTREEGETLHLADHFYEEHTVALVTDCGGQTVIRSMHRQKSVTYNQGRNGLGSSLSSYLLALLQRAVEEGGENPDVNPDERELNVNFL